MCSYCMNQKVYKKKHEKIVLVGKYKLNTIEILISKALTKLYVSHDEFVLISNVLKKYNEIKKILKHLWNALYKYG